MNQGHPRRILGVLVALAAAAIAHAEGDAVGPAQPIGVWRGTSICTDRVVAPACKDETVVYEFTAGSQPGTVHWAADKIVNGERQRMYDVDLAYDTAEGCWKAEFTSPRRPSVRGVWRLSVDGARLTGSGQMLPGKELFRKIEARKD